MTLIKSLLKPSDLRMMLREHGDAPGLKSARKLAYGVLVNRGVKHPRSKRRGYPTRRRRAQ